MLNQISVQLLLVMHHDLTFNADHFLILLTIVFTSIRVALVTDTHPLHQALLRLVITLLTHLGILSL